MADTIIMLRTKGGAQGQAAGASAPSAQPAPAAQYYPSGSDATSLRGEMGFEEEFPLDFSELSGGADPDIPF